VLQNSSNQEIADCLGFNESVDQTHVRDLIIIGAGPSGLAAAKVRQEQIHWRRDKVLELAVDGYLIREFETILKIPRATIHRDIVLFN
jgi:hypothetical protein